MFRDIPHTIPAYAPSRNDLGTARIASSLMDATIGMIIIPTTNAALKALKKLTRIPNWSSNTLFNIGVTNESAKYPYTTVGIPANNSNKGFKTLLNLSEAYSLKKIALPNPNGKAIEPEMTAIINVPRISGRTPKFSGLTWDAKGLQFVPVKNVNKFTSGRRKKPIASENNETIIPMVTKIEKTPHPKRMIAIIRSLKFLTLCGL